MNNNCTNTSNNNYIKLILYFFIFSFTGWLLETAYCYSQIGSYIKRGFLYGPICPIYGFGALILIVFLSKYKKKSFKLFITAAVVCSIFEYFVGYILDAVFSLKWWDYTSEFLNLNGRISILFSFSWGIIAIIFINHAFPFIEKYLSCILNKLSLKRQYLLSFTLIFLLLTDLIFSCIKYIHLPSIIV